VYPRQTGTWAACRDSLVRVRVRLHVTSGLEKRSKSNFPAKPRPATRPIGSAGGPTCRPIGTPEIDVSAKFRNAAREGSRGDGGGKAHRQRARVSVPYAQFRDGREATCVLVWCYCYSSAISVRRCFSDPDPDHPTSRLLQLCPDDLTSKP